MVQKMKALLVIAGLIAPVFGLQAGEASKAVEKIQADKSKDEVAANLKKLYPATRFGEVRDTPVPGIKEVVVGKNVVYVSNDGQYFLFGNLFDMRNQHDLTSDRQDEVNPGRKMAFNKLPLNQAIKVVKGKGERKVAIFTDPDCPYCHTLEKELAGIDNLTAYIFLYPIDEIHPASKEKAVSIWCAQKPADAWSKWMISKEMPAKKDCSNPIDSNVTFARDNGIEGTPTLIAGDGRVMPGAAKREQIEAWLNGAKND